MRIAEKGAALIELALIVPVMVLLALAATESVIWLRSQLNVSALSRDLGRASFDCAADPVDAQLCLDTRISWLFDNGSLGPMTNADYVVTIWNFEGSGRVARMAARHAKDRLASRIDGEDVKDFRSYSSAHQRIIVAEVEMTRPSRMPSFVGNYYSIAVF